MHRGGITKAYECLNHLVVKGRVGKRTEEDPLGYMRSLLRYHNVEQGVIPSSLIEKID